MMLPNDTGFLWNEKRQRAAQLVAEDQITDVQIAESLGITKNTLERWKRRPEFQAEVKRIVDETAAKLQAKGIRSKENRLRALDERHRRMMALLEARASQLSGQATGADSGLLDQQIVVSKYGSAYRYVFDSALLRELREHEKQAAQELGQWSERSTSLNIDLDQCTDEQLERIANGEDPVRVLADTGRSKT